jgi:hypothetical protein
MTVHLASTGQEVHEQQWSGEGKPPWPSNKRRIMRPFVGQEGKSGRYKAELLIVHKDRLQYR